MKLAEALVERKAALNKIKELGERLNRVILIQEGDTPVEAPAALLAELQAMNERWLSLTVAINRTNVQAQLPDGRTVMEALAERDVLYQYITVMDGALRSTQPSSYRSSFNEIKYVLTVNVPEMQRDRDRLAKRYRELDTAIQQANWNTELAA